MYISEAHEKRPVLRTPAKKRILFSHNHKNDQSVTYTLQNVNLITLKLNKSMSVSTPKDGRHTTPEVYLMQRQAVPITLSGKPCKPESGILEHTDRRSLFNSQARKVLKSYNFHGSFLFPACRHLLQSF